MISSYVPPLEHFIYYSTVGIIISLLLFKYLIPEKNNATSDNPILTEKKGFQLPDKNLVLLGLLAFFAMVAEGMMTDWSSEYMKHVTHAPIQLIGYGLTAYMFAMASGRFISDFTVRRFGEQRTLLFYGILLFIGLGASVLFPGVYTTIISFMIVGLGVSAVVPMCYNLAGHTKTMPPQQALTLITSIGFIGFFLGPPVIGFIAQHSSLKTAFAIVAFFGLAISLLSRFIVIESTSSK